MLKRNLLYLKGILALVCVLLASLVLVACDGDTTPIPPKTNEITSEKSKISFTFPAEWKETDLNKFASIERADVATDEYFILIEESRDNFEEGYPLDRYAETIAVQMVGEITSPRISDWSEIYIGKEDIPALQAVITGESENITNTYLLTVFQSDSMFFQCISWSLQSKYAGVEKNLLEILNSVKLR